MGRVTTAKTPVLTKGERTRLSILQATLKVIAQQGLQGVTHRAVAREASVSLSLTTYYFKDLQELLLESFRLHKQLLYDEATPGLLSYHDEALAYRQCVEQGDLAGARAQIEAIARQLSDFIIEEVRSHAEGLIVEMAFYFDMHLPAHLRQATYELRQYFIDDARDLAERLGSEDPLSDAEILIGALQHLRYEALSVPEQMTEVKIRRRILHLVTRLWRV